MRGWWCSQSLVLLLAVLTAFPCPSFAAESGEDEYRCALPSHCRNGAALSPEMGVFAPPAPFFKNV